MDQISEQFTLSVHLPRLEGELGDCPGLDTDLVGSFKAGRQNLPKQEQKRRFAYAVVSHQGSVFLQGPFLSPETIAAAVKSSDVHMGTGVSVSALL